MSFIDDVPPTPPRQERVFSSGPQGTEEKKSPTGNPLTDKLYEFLQTPEGKKYIPMAIKVLSKAQAKSADGQKTPESKLIKAFGVIVAHLLTFYTMRWSALRDFKKLKESNFEITPKNAKRAISLVGFISYTAARSWTAGTREARELNEKINKLKDD